MSQVQQLYRLQLLDSKLSKAAQELAKVMANLGENEAFKTAKAEVESTTEALTSVQKTQKDTEVEVKDLSDKISNQEKLLYSGKALSAKEAANLQEEIESLKRWHGTREEALLEIMVETEEKEEALDQANGKLVEVEAAWKAEQGDLIQQKEDFEREINGLKEQRPTILAGISDAILAEYDANRKKRAGVAVAGVKDGMCQACGIMVSNNKIQQARSSSELVYCGTCGRILYIL